MCKINLKKQVFINKKTYYFNFYKIKVSNMIMYETLVESKSYLA
jgi:hypothetical protein